MVQSLLWLRVLGRLVLRGGADRTCVRRRRSLQLKTAGRLRSVVPLAMGKVVLAAITRLRRLSEA